MKKASKRKEQEPDFEVKKFNMSVEAFPEADDLDFDKENEHMKMMMDPTKFPKDPYYDNDL